MRRNAAQIPLRGVLHSNAAQIVLRRVLHSNAAQLALAFRWLRSHRSCQILDRHEVHNRHRREAEKGLQSLVNSKVPLLHPLWEDLRFPWLLLAGVVQPQC